MKRIETMSASLVGLAVAAALPLEESVSGWYDAPYILLKLSLAAAALALPVAGVGSLFVAATRRLHSLLTKDAPRIDLAPVEHALQLGASLLLGVVLLGLVTFLLGQVVRPSLALGVLVAATGYVAAYFALRPGALLPESARALAGGIRTGWRDASGTEKLAWSLVSALFLLKLVTGFAYQQHGDPYSYTVSASDRWLRLGRTGFDIRDIHTGYALGCEHFFLFLKLVLRGHTEQYVVGTLYSIVAGFGTFATGMLALTRRLASPAVVLVAAFVLQSTFTYISWQPRNDAFLAGFALLAVAGLALELPGLFLAAAAGDFIVKAPGAITFVALGVSALATTAARGEMARFRTTLVLLFAGAVLMVLVWSPFALYNGLRTGNPLFPLANEIFKSPYAPPQFEHVIDDMAPLTVTPWGSLRGLGRMFGTHVLYVLGGILLVAGAFPWKRGVKPLASFYKDPVVPLLIAFVLVDAYLMQLATREYSPDFASRHLFAVFGALAVVTISGAVRTVGEGRLARFARPVLLVLAFSGAGAEVAVQEIVRFFRTPNQTALIQERQPILKLTAFLDRYVRDHGLEGVRVVSVSNNRSYFLTNAEFWHETKTYPMWSWPISEMTTEDWGREFKANGLGYAITGPEEKEISRRVEALPHEILLETGEYKLIRFL